MAPLFARGEAGDDALVVIADAASIGARAYIAKQLAKAGFSKIEPISGTTLYAAAKKFEKENDFKQLKATMGFIGDCMTGTGQTPFLSAVEARRKGLRKGTAQFGPLVDLGLALTDNPRACRKSNPDILVVQPAENWAAKNVPGPLDGARDRRILLQG